MRTLACARRATGEFPFRGTRGPSAQQGRAADRADRSQVHEIHPSDPFLVILDKPTRARSEPVIEHPTLTPDDSGELCAPPFL